MFRFSSRLDKSPFGAVCEQQAVSFRFGVRKDVSVTSVTLCVRHTQTTALPMQFAYDWDGYAYYNVSFCPPTWGLYFYRFEVNTPNGILFVGRDESGSAIGGDFLPEWQMTVYKPIGDAEVSGRDIVYHIFVDRFAKKEGAVAAPADRYYKQWDEDVDVEGQNGDVYRAQDFYGGNLAGIEDKLDYLVSLGVTIVYLSPIFESVSNHRYDTADYTKIDPLLGTEEDFARLVAEARKRGIRIMLDGVFNHTGSDSIYFNKEGRFDSLGAYQSEQSPYRDWFTFRKGGKYDCWWGIENVPTINKHSRAAQEFLFGDQGPVAHWSRYDVDWRLDVVDELPDNYLNCARRCIRKACPTSHVVGEVWEDASNKISYGQLRHYFTSGQLDGVMNYVFKEAILRYCLGGSPKAFADKVMDLVENYPRHCMDRSLTLLDSHDTVRVINALAGVNTVGWNKKMQRDYRLSAADYRRAKDKLYIAATLQYLLPGMPSIYYGDEVGMQGFADPINRRPYPWDNQNEELLSFYRTLGSIRAHYANILRGSIRFAPHNELLVMERNAPAGELTVVANATDQPHTCFVYQDCVDLLADRPHHGQVFLPPNSVMVLHQVGAPAEPASAPARLDNTPNLAF